MALSQGGSVEDLAWSGALAKMNRSSVAPSRAAALYSYFFDHVDVRASLPLVDVPTLVVHNRGNPLVPLSHGQYLADHIKGARLVELPLNELTWSGQSMDQFLDVVTTFLEGAEPVREAERVLATVVFTDIVASTELAVARGDARWRTLLDTHDLIVRTALDRFGGREVKTTGDGFVASFTGPARAIRCARSIIESAAALGIQIRAGLHTGECDLRGNDLTGLAVHIAARVGSAAGPGEVLVTSTVVDLVAGSGLDFDDRGHHELKGVPGVRQLWALA